MERLYDTLKPADISKELLPEITRLNLQKNCIELAEHGWTILTNVATPKFNRQLRQSIVDQSQDSASSVGGGGGGSMLLTQGDVFAEAVINQKLMAMAEFSVGRGFLLSQLASSIRTKESSVIGLHAEHNWLPAPFPEHNMLLSAIWACDEFTREGGATLIVPDSHRHRRHPQPIEAAFPKNPVSVECPANSVVLWDGNLWHSNWPRTIEGERVVLHILYSRLSMRPVEDYNDQADRLCEQYGDAMSQLLGRNDFLQGNGTASSSLVTQTFNNAKR